MDAWLNRRLYHPLAQILAVALKPTGISPNAVSIAGGLLVCVTALLYTRLEWPVSAILGFATHASWHVLDGADGKLARLSGKASPMGELVDGVCDYAGHIVLYLVLGAALDDRLGVWAWVLVVGAGVSRIVQSNYVESQRRTYLWRVYGVPWLRQAHAASDELFARRGLFTRFFTILARGYIALAAAVSPPSDRIDDAVERTAGGGRDQARTRRLCRRAGRTTLRLQAWLGANPRTVLLGASMALGSPAYFFLVECTLLNVVLICCVMLQKRCNIRLEEKLETMRWSTKARG